MAGSEQQQENLGRAPAPMQPAHMNLLPGSAFTNPGPAAVWIVNPGVFADWLNRNWVARVQHLRARVQRANAAAQRGPYAQYPTSQYDGGDWSYDDYDDWEGMSGIDGLEPEAQGQHRPSSQDAGAVGQILPRHPTAPRGPILPRHPAAASAAPARRVAAPFAGSQQEIARLRQALAACQQAAARAPHPTVAQMEAIKAKHLQHMIWEMEQALCAATELIARENHALQQGMLSGEGDEDIGGEDDLGRARRRRAYRKRYGLGGEEETLGAGEEQDLAGDGEDISGEDDLGRARRRHRRRHGYGLGGEQALGAGEEQDLGGDEGEDVGGEDDLGRARRRRRRGHGLGGADDRTYAPPPPVGAAPPEQLAGAPVAPVFQLPGFTGRTQQGGGYGPS